jgi:hypothetical protein
MLEAMRCTAIALAAVLAWATGSALALADPGDPGAGDDEATRIFQQGRELAKQGRLSEACALFSKSYDLDPGLGTAINLADCLEHQGQLRRAWELFDVVARNSQNVVSRARLARQRADALLAKLARVVVVLREPRPAGLAIRLGDREMAPSAEIRDLIEPRDVELVATAPGRPVYRKVLHAVAGATVTAEVPAFPPLPDESTTRRQRSRVYVAGGVGAAGALSLGAALGLALSARSIYNGAFPGQCMRDHGIVHGGGRRDDRARRPSGRLRDRLCHRWRCARRRGRGRVLHRAARDGPGRAGRGARRAGRRHRRAILTPASRSVPIHCAHGLTAP